MSEVIPDIEPIRVRLQAAAPTGWYISPTTIERRFEPRDGYPAMLYEVEALAKRPAGKRGPYLVMRSVSVTIRTATVDALEEAVKALPALDPFLALPLDTEIRLASYDD